MHLIPTQIEYPDSDGQPMADNTLQHEWIGLLKSNLTILFGENPNVFVAGDLLWYPVYGDSETRQAPDVLVVFERPKGYRGSYKQWEENDTPITVVFEILSPSNSRKEMANKRLFYEEYGVEEYYVINPYRNNVDVYLRRGEVFLRQRLLKNFVSPRLGIRFVRREKKLILLLPDGSPFLTEEERERLRIKAEIRAEQAELREAKLARLLKLSLRASRNQATAEELAELKQYEREATP